MLRRLFSFFSSLRLTVVLLGLALGLVFIGTLAQVKWGLYIVQSTYFHSLFVTWTPKGTAWKIPVWPGGWLLGFMLLANLISAHVKRFSFSKKKIGIFVVHAGLIFMLVGQFLTEVFQTESFMAIPQGGSKNYSESGMKSELAIVDTTDANFDNVVAIPEKVLGTRTEIRHEALPFTIRVKSYFQNSVESLASDKNGKAHFEFVKADLAVKMNDRNIPATSIELTTSDGTRKELLLSNWTEEEMLLSFLQRKYRSKFPADLGQPTIFAHQGHTYRLAMRPKRYYKPFTVQLLKFTHERYLGTDIPKDFSSRVRLVRPETKEDREALIFMNNPLRYWGETYYQGGFAPDDSGTILQVVRNPSWLTPYISCAIVAGGLLIQFLSHLYTFAKKRTKTA